MTKEKTKNPPKLAEWILSCVYPDRGDFTSVGDFREEYLEVYSESGPFKANLWYWMQIAKSIPNFIRNKSHWSIIMIQNYLKIALRNIKRHKGYSFINIAGLAIGMTCSILIVLYVQFELSFEKFHKNADNIYRVIMHQEGNFFGDTDWLPWTPPILAPTLKKDLPEVIHAARFESSRQLITYRDKKIYEEDFCYTDPEFFDIFTFSVIKGNPRTALNEPFSLLITPQMAEKYFGNEDPVGKIINIDNTYDFNITGIIENCPQNTHIKYNFLASFISLEKIRGGDFYRWGYNFHDTYLLLQNNADPEETENKLKEYDMAIGIGSRIWSFHIWPLQDIHFKGIGNRKGESDIRYIYVFSATAFFLMFLACFNYMNLSTSQSFTRAKEIGIRKVAGANRHQLITQFLGESILFSFTALIISVLLVHMFLPVFSSFIDKKLSFSFFNNSWMLAGLIIFSVLTGLLSGSYPAFLISSFKPVGIMKGHLKSSPKGTALFRNTLVTTQFVISIIMIACTAVVYMQLNFIRNSKLGYDKNYVITLPLRARENLSPLKNELEKYSKIQEVTVAQDPPNEIGALAQANWEGKDPTDLKQIRFNSVDYNYIDFYGMEIIMGRNFSRDFATDLHGAFILNETAVKEFGFDNPIGMKMSIWGHKGEIIGVIKDFHSASMHLSIEPVAFRVYPDWFSMFSIKISSEDIPETIAFLEDTWKKFSPEYPFEYSFLDEEVDRMYRTEQRLGRSFFYFTVIAIFIASLGLFGLISYSAERRTKEIGIRKVLGAQISNITWLLSKEFLFLVCIANIIAWPVAYYFMNKWLQNFAYRINIGLGIFLASGMIALIIALLTVSYQSIKAATANPVDSLRYE